MTNPGKGISRAISFLIGQLAWPGFFWSRRCDGSREQRIYTTTTIVHYGDPVNYAATVRQFTTGLSYPFEVWAPFLSSFYRQVLADPSNPPPTHSNMSASRTFAKTLSRAGSCLRQQVPMPNAALQRPSMTAAARMGMLPRITRPATLCQRTFSTTVPNRHGHIHKPKAGEE